jgi:hypothetical protein
MYAFTISRSASQRFSATSLGETKIGSVCCVICSSSAIARSTRSWAVCSSSAKGGKAQIEQMVWPLSGRVYRQLWAFERARRGSRPAGWFNPQTTLEEQCYSRSRTHASSTAVSNCGQAWAGNSASTITAMVSPARRLRPRHGPSRPESRDAE